jgi:hypothetical protein
VLMVATTEGVLDGVEGNTTHLGPLVPLGLVLVEGGTGLEHGLVDTATTRDDANHAAARVGNGLACARGELDAGLLGILVLGHDGAVVAGGTGDGAAVAGPVLEVADHGTLGELTHGKDIAHSHLGLLAAVDELASVHALSSAEELLLDLVVVGAAELNHGEGGTPARIVDDLLDDPLDVPRPLSEVKVPQRHGTLPVLRVRLEDGPLTLTDGLDDTTHCTHEAPSSVGGEIFFKARTSCAPAASFRIVLRGTASQPSYSVLSICTASTSPPCARQATGNSLLAS